MLAVALPGLPLHPLQLSTPPLACRCYIILYSNIVAPYSPTNSRASVMGIMAITRDANKRSVGRISSPSLMSVPYPLPAALPCRRSLTSPSYLMTSAWWNTLSSLLSTAGWLSLFPPCSAHCFCCPICQIANGRPSRPTVIAPLFRRSSTQ
jgi:hypothetical protein